MKISPKLKGILGGQGLPVPRKEMTLRDPAEREIPEKESLGNRPGEIMQRGKNQAEARRAAAMEGREKERERSNRESPGFWAKVEECAAAAMEGTKRLFYRKTAKVELEGGFSAEVQEAAAVEEPKRKPAQNAPEVKEAALEISGGKPVGLSATLAKNTVFERSREMLGRAGLKGLKGLKTLAGLAEHALAVAQTAGGKIKNKMEDLAEGRSDSPIGLSEVA